VTDQGPALSLREVADAVVDGRSGPEQLLEALLAATVWCEAPETPGVVPAQTPAGPVVCVHSSPAELAAARGAVPWFSCTGADLLALLPDGLDLLLDPAGARPLVLRTAALRRAVRVE
jgi:hypothetical protein